MPVSWVALVAGLTLAVTFFPHGAQKTLGWFGGYEEPGYGMSSGLVMARSRLAN